uniref:Kinetochore protein NDC80 n=1 Tax=Panagrolaimus sp. ES5 TaxID=591445 RepID=A0AC34FDP4_9BILA
MDDRFRTNNSRTPQHSTGRNSIFGRPSLYGQGNARNSMRPSDVGRFSYGVQASAMKKGLPHHITKNTRNVRDKAYIEEQKGIIRDFLQEKHSQLDPKCLTSPTTNQFHALFEFIYSHLDPDYQVSSSTIKDEFPQIMKSLKYPLQIKVSTMQSVSSGTSWPYLLDALGYLVNFVTKVETMNVMSLLGDEGSDSNRFLSYEYFTKCFNKQKAGHVTEDGFAAEYKNFRESVMQNENIDEAEEIAKEKLAMEEELAELKKECLQEECRELEKEKAVYEKDNKALKTYLEDANACRTARLAEDKKLQEIINEKEALLKKIHDEIDQKRQKINNQPISAQKAREATNKLKTVRDRLKVAGAEKKEAEEGSTELQGTLFKLFASLNQRVATVGGKISDIAADFYSHEEHSQHGFSDLGIHRPMDLDKVKARLKYFVELYDKLLAKMDQDVEEKRHYTKQHKDAVAECERAVERINISTKKLVQDGEAKLKELSRRNNDLQYEAKNLEIQAGVLNEKQILADDRLQKIHKELEKLQIQIGEVEVLYGKRKKEWDDKYGDMADNCIEKAEIEVQKHIQIRKVQKDQDDEMERLIDQHSELINRVHKLDEDDDSASE